MNKKYLIAVGGVLLVLIAFYFVGKQNTPIKNYPPKNSIVVAFGDSLIEGVGATKGKDFISLLSVKLNRPILNFGISGNTTRDGLARIKQITDLNPGTVILLLGGNDYLKRIPEEETFKNLKEIVTVLQSKGIMVILLGIRGGLLSDRFEKSFEKIAEETNVIYIPNVLDGLFGNQKYMSDVVHPNDLGYAKIEEKVYPEIKDYITP